MGLRVCMFVVGVDIGIVGVRVEKEWLCFKSWDL